MRIYKEYKEIAIKDIKGCNINAINKNNVDMIYLERKAIKRDGIRKPIEVIETENGYQILNGRKRLLAAKTLGYDKVPCLIRDRMKEILLRKVMKKLMLTEEDLTINYTN
ncbi:MAG: ParB N-terminal domain-containing protein [Clostridium sp.]|nr:ParB N-terminal domain-containing protein [Clostridium sp.]